MRRIWRSLNRAERRSTGKPTARTFLSSRGPMRPRPTNTEGAACAHGLVCEWTGYNKYLLNFIFKYWYANLDEELSLNFNESFKVSLKASVPKNKKKQKNEFLFNFRKNCVWGFCFFDRNFYNFIWYKFHLNIPPFRCFIYTFFSGRRDTF